MKKRADNRGFTLIELVVVIAILAVLTVVVAPQYLKYVDKSRAAVCMQNRAGIVRSFVIQTVFGEQKETLDADYSDYCPTGGTYTLSIQADLSLKVRCSEHGDSISGAGEKPDDTMDFVYIFDPILGEYAEIPVQGTGIGAKSADIRQKIIYFEGNDDFEAGYYYINAAQYSSDIKDMDAYLDIILKWSKRNFVKLENDKPIQVYNPADETGKKVNKENNSSVVQGQFYYIDFQWDDVDGPVLAIYTGNTNDTWWRGDLTDDTKWPTNKGVWTILK